MLWQILLLLASLWDRHPQGPDDETDYKPNPCGPQTWKEAERAAYALYGKHDDMRFESDDNPLSYAVAMEDERYHWKMDNRSRRILVPYEIDPALENLKDLIEQAMKQYSKSTCIRFIKKYNQADYIRIVKGVGCWSRVGRVGGPQRISLGDGCHHIGTVVHELGHAMGLLHEHQRSDRKRHLVVRMENVKKNMTQFLDEHEPSEEIRGLEYDTGSVMHYGRYAFSTHPGKLETLVPKDRTVLKDPFEKCGLTAGDVELLNRMYKCK